jgi:adenylate cyclase
VDGRPQFACKCDGQPRLTDTSGPSQCDKPMRAHEVGQPQRAHPRSGRALTISPNLASAHRALGTTLIFSGEPEQGLAALQTSVRLDPRDPLLPWHLNRLAIGHYFARDYEAAVDAARRVIRLYPDFPLIYRWLAALGQLGRVDEAQDALNKAIAIGSGSFDMYVRERVPWNRAEDYEHMLDGLRKSGWRE